MKIQYVYTLIVLLVAGTISQTVAECSSWNASQARMRKAARAESQKIYDYWQKFDVEIEQAEANLTKPDLKNPKLKRKKNH